jgi:O-antigen/teichoic acid export membrane protein
LISFFSLFGISPIGLYVNRKINQWILNKTVINHLSLYNIYIACIALLSIPAVFIAQASTHISSTISLFSSMVIISLCIYSTTWNSTIIPVFNLLGRRTEFVVFSFLTSAANLGFSVALSVFFSKTAYYWLLGQIVAQSIITIIALQHFRKVLSEERASRWWKQIARSDLKVFILFILPLAITSLCYWAQTQSYRIIIERFVGLEYLALIGVGFGLSSRLAAIVESLVQQYFYPAYLKRITTDKKDNRINAWSFIAENTIPVYLSIAIFISCIAPFLTKILIGDNFQDAYLFVIFGIWIEFFRMATGVFSSVAHSEMKTSFLLVPNITGGIFGIGGTYLCVKFFHSNYSVPVLLVFCGIVTTIVTALFMKKLLPLHLNYRKLLWSIILTLPVFLVLLFKNHATVITSGIILGVSGLYLLFIQLILFLRSSKYTRSAVYSDIE